MKSLEESDEEYLDDPIQLIDFRKATETVTNHNQETNQTIFELTDPEGDLYIEKNNVFQKTIPYKKVSITLPVSFFELPQNVRLLNSCKQLYIKVVNCEKHPWYHKQFLSSYYSDNDGEVDFYTKKIFKDMELQNNAMIERSMKIKISPVSSPYENLKKENTKNKPKRKEIKLKQSVVAVSNPQINFKKNQGLIGMKIIQTPNNSLKLAVEKKNITMSDKTMETPKITKDKAQNWEIVQEKKKEISKNVKTVKNKEDASTSSATNVTKITDDRSKIIQNDVIGIEKFKEITIKDITITKVDSHDKKMQDKNKVQSTENLNIATETNIQKTVDKIGTAAPIPKTNINISEKDDKVNLKNNINDKKIQNNTKSQLSNKLNTGNIAKTQEVTEKVYKFSTASKSKIPEIKDKTNQNNVQIIGNKTSSTLNAQKGKTDSNNANGLAKLNIVNNKHLTFDDSKRSANYKNTALDQLVLYSGGQLEEQLCLATNKRKYNPDTTYSAKLQGLKLTVTKKDSANNINNIAKNSKIQKDTNRAKNTDTKRKVQKKTNSDPVKSIGNDSSSSLGSQNNNILNMLLFKPVNNKPKKCNADKLIKPRKKLQKPVNLISSNSEINQAQPRLSNEIMKNDNLHITNYKCKNPQNSNECNYYPSNSGVDKLSHLFDSTPAPVVGKSQTSSFYIHEYKKIMQSSSQHNPEQVDFKDSNQQVKNPLIYKKVEENTRPEVYQSKPKTESLQTSVNLRNDNLPENVADNNHSNVFAKQNLTNDMKPNPASVILNPSAPISIQNVNQNQDCFATGQSSACISKYTHVVQNQPHQIPLNIANGKRCPRIIKISKRNLTVPYMKTNEISNPAAGLHLDAFDFASQRNDNNQRNANSYRIQDRPIQTLVTTRDNMPKQKPLNMQQNQINSQILSNLYSATQQVTRNSFIPNQNVQQLSIAHQTKQPIVSPNIQTGSHVQAAGPQYKTSHEILPPTCDIALVKMTPVNDIQKLQHQNMPNIMCHPQQQRHISHTILRNESHLGRDKLQMQPNMKTASCQNLGNLKILVQEKPNTAMRQNIYKVTPRQEINQNSVPFNYGFVHQKISPHGQRFQQAFSEFSGFSPQNYINFAPIYDGPPNHMNPRNQMQNYWGTLYNPSIPPPPPPPPPPLLPIHKDAQGQVVNQMHAPYQEYNNPSTPKSVAGTTIIGHDDSGPVRKININVEPLSKQNTIQQPCEQGNFDNETKKSLFYQGTDNKGVSGHSPVAYSKKEMLEELTKITTIESSNLSPVKDLKRPLPNSNSNTMQEIPNIKKYKPGPLSRKLKFESTTAPQTNTSVAPVTHKGYSPPILPIPTYQKTLEILARSNISDPRLSHSITADDRKTESLNAMRSVVNNKLEIVQNEKCSFDENQDKSAKKISLDEYKKRSSIIEDKNIKMEIKMENPEQDLGYDSDSTTKV